MDKHWVCTNLLDDAGLTRKFAHRVQMSAGQLPPDAYRSRTISEHISSSPTRLGRLEHLVQTLLHGATGDWLYAGWIDQAVLHVGMCLPGGTDLLTSMLRQFDDDQVDQGGDMLVGFLPSDRNSFLTIEVSPDDNRFTVVLYTDSEPEAARVRSVAGP